MVDIQCFAHAFTGAFFIQSTLFRGTRARAHTHRACLRSRVEKKERKKEERKEETEVDFERGRSKVSRRTAAIRRYIGKYASKKETVSHPPPPPLPPRSSEKGDRWRRDELGQITVGSCDRIPRRARRAFYSSSTFVCGKTYSRGATLAKFCDEGYWKFRFV